jgi:glycosyltransferase involved in cell wall biosynthesis
MNNIDLVSVIIPVYNRMSAFRRALRSVLAQTYPSIEIIVVDDGSIDDRDEIDEIAHEENRFDIRILCQTNSGPGIARRNGLNLARGKYIQYLDSDDEIRPCKIEKQVEELGKDEEAVLCYTPTLQISSKGEQNIRRFSDQPSNDLLATALQWRRWHTSSCLWRYPNRSVPVWSHLYNGEDVVHDVSVGVIYQKVLFLPEVMTIAYHDASCISVRPNDPQKLERYKSDILESPLICMDFLRQKHLLKISRYVEPLSERMYHSGLVLAKLGDFEKSLILLGRSRSLTSNVLKKTEILIAQSLVLTTKASKPKIYSFLFRLHKKLVKPEVHVYRSV